MPAAARAIGLQATVLNASNKPDIDDAFATMVEQQINALFVSADPMFLNQRDQLVALSMQHAVVTIYADREIVEAGGLISYGASRSDAYRQAGNYVGRILKGEKPASLPVMLPTKFEMVLNLKTAKALGLAVPQSILVASDELIE